MLGDIDYIDFSKFMGLAQRIDFGSSPVCRAERKGLWGRNCRPTAAARSAAFSKALGVDLRDKTTDVERRKRE